MAQDQHILDGIRSGNHETITEVYKTYFGMIQNLVIKNSGNESDAEDLFQDAMVVCYKNFNKKAFKLTVKFKTYLYSVSRNLWLSELHYRGKHTKKLKDYERHIEIEDSFDSHWKEAREKNIVRIEQAMKYMGDKCRELLILFYFRRLSLKEIAAELDYSNTDSVKSQKYKCIRQLKYSLNLWLRRRT